MSSSADYVREYLGAPNMLFVNEPHHCRKELPVWFTKEAAQELKIETNYPPGHGE